MKKIWFKRKQYGWGWYPYSKEGWIVTIIAVLAILVIGLNYGGTPYFIPSVIAIALILILIARKTGEEPKWSWGK